ncbi:MAG: hypothetical protein LAP21_21300 [Acidobacteriia bacterium]|nr:hypothetical protein [Terriglobia bacterium]
MSVIDDLRQHPDDYQLMYCWARAIEWKMWPAFVAQPLLPLFYIFYPWKLVLLGLVIVNFTWNLMFCTAFISLPLTAIGMLWAKLKWIAMAVAFGAFAWRHNWILAILSLSTPLIAPFIGVLTVRRPVGVIQDFFMLQLGHVKADPSPEIARYLSKIAGKSNNSR